MAEAKIEAPGETGVVDVALGVVRRGRRVLVTRRPDEAIWGGAWEFPGGKCEPGESPRDAVMRELREELDVRVLPTGPLPPVEHVYRHAHVRLHGWWCELPPGQRLRLIAVAEARWVTAAGLQALAMLPANGPIVHRIVTMLSM